MSSVVPSPSGPVTCGGLQGAFSSHPAICKITDATYSHEIYR